MPRGIRRATEKKLLGQRLTGRKQKKLKAKRDVKRVRYFLETNGIINAASVGKIRERERERKMVRRYEKTSPTVELKFECKMPSKQTR